MAFAVKLAARLLLSPPEGGLITTRQASLNAADRLVAPSNEASDAGLRPGPFPDRAASLLPGLLAATRTGLTPAGDDELMLDHDLHIDLHPGHTAETELAPVPRRPLLAWESGCVAAPSAASSHACNFVKRELWLAGGRNAWVFRPTPRTRESSTRIPCCTSCHRRAVSVATITPRSDHRSGEIAAS